MITAPSRHLTSISPGYIQLIMKDEDTDRRTRRKRDPELMAMVAANIRRFREEKGWTQDELRKRIGWKSKTMVSQLENCQTGVGPQTLRRLANIFQKAPSEFFQMASTPRESRNLAQMPYVDLGGKKERDKPADGQPLHLEYKDVFRFEDLVRKLSDAPGPDARVLLPRWPEGKENHHLIWAIVDKINFLPPEGTSLGDVICIDCDEQPDFNRTDPPGVYAVRLEKEVKLCRLEIHDQRITIRNINKLYWRDGGMEGITIDLRAYPSAIIGRVLWVLTTY